MEDALQPAFEEANPDIKLAFTFDSSGKLQTQIEEGADVDVFFSAATKQMNALDEEGLMDSDTIVDLLENKIALIVPAGSETGITGFEAVSYTHLVNLQRRNHSVENRSHAYANPWIFCLIHNL